MDQRTIHQVIERPDAERTRKLKEGARVGVVGLGYVGLPLAVLIDQHGYDVAGYDTDPQKATAVMRRTSTILTPAEQHALRNSNIVADIRTTVLEGAEIFVICVPTPVNEQKEPDFTALLGAAETVGHAMDRGALVIVESTVSPGVSEEIVIPAIEKASGLSVTRDFHYAYCPERINPGDPKYGVHNIPRVLGATDQKSLRRAYDFYHSILDGEIVPMQNVKEAEAVKMVENAFRDINIAFVNELAMSFERAGIDIVNVIDGAATKPFGFMAHYPSCGVGGHCIPVDPYYLIRYGKRNGFTHRFLITARNVNELMPHYTVALLENALRNEAKTLHGSAVALLGLAYKRDIGDMRESPALTIMNDLKEAGAHVYTFDPHTTHRYSVASLDAALTAADAVIIATDHEDFCTLTPDDFREHNVRIVIDGKNCLSKEAFEHSGIVYRGIGR